MPFEYDRTIRFAETDAAGVVYFAHVLSLCHEAYEASLIAAGFELKSFFQNSEQAFPIVHASVDFRRPIYCGDRAFISLAPQNSENSSEFNIYYEIFIKNKSVAVAQTRHVCIHPNQRSRQPLSHEILQWIKLYQV
ncbi:MAG: acyl-CoA thioesterase [Desertifilum sp.]|nr:acyl-CoA thioesterase [Desertifilum sp.]